MAPQTKYPRQENSANPDWGGMDPVMMKSIVSKIPPNPLTGRVEMNDIMTYMAEHPAEMETMMSALENTTVFAPSTDLDKFNYSSLKRTIRSDSLWVMQLESMAVTDAQGQTVPVGHEHTTPGARPNFTMYCYDDKEVFRLMHECSGLPTANDLLTAVRSAIASPLPPCKPALPELFLISSRLAPHLDLARPFLDSLPKPFTWRLETGAEAENVASGVHRMNKQGVKEGRRLGAEAKAAGNVAFAQKDRAAAVMEYSHAIKCYVDALSQKPDTGEKKEMKKQLSICYANRAAAWLLDGDGLDATKALEDGMAAVETNPAYAKGYVREAAAQEKLGDKAGAIDALRRALERPDLENEGALVDRLIELLTDGKGLSDDEAEFKQWVLDIGVNSGSGSSNLLKLKGAWKKRMDAKFMQWQTALD